MNRTSGHNRSDASMKNARTTAILKSSILWIGLSLCGFAIWKHRWLAATALNQASLAAWGGIAMLMLTCWLLSVASWREYLRAYTGTRPSISLAIRQTGLLLIGKYIPGGIFGFLARFYDGTITPSSRLLWAGIIEQTAGIGMTLLLGILLYLCTTQKQLWLLFLTPTLPLIVTLSARCIHSISIPFRRLNAGSPSRNKPHWPSLTKASVIQLSQLLAWTLLTGLVSAQLPQLTLHEQMGLSGAFLISVSVGMLAFFVPGGIGVREATFIALAAPWASSNQAILLAAEMRIITTMIDATAGAASLATRSTESQ
ncbi:MAG TPA: hypothetical protein PKD55_17160 [Bellilinea sp.]|nr:hypothetical protein [Bellilinea sp.]